MRSYLALLLLAGACSSNYSGDSNEPPLAPPERTFDDGGSADGGADAIATSDASTKETGPVDSGDEGIPFAQHLVLRLDLDAPGGLDGSSVPQDLSGKSHAITLAAGASVIETSTNGAKALVFDGNGPLFDVADAADLRFGATDDFFVVGRGTVTVPLESGSGCAFHYLFSKYDSDGQTAAHLRVCAPNTGRSMIASLKVGLVDAATAVPNAATTSHVILGAGRRDMGKTLEVRVGGATFKSTVATPVDVSAAGSPFVLGGARLNGTGSPFARYIGKLNRLYVFHAPPGTLSSANFEMIASWVEAAPPLP